MNDETLEAWLATRPECVQKLAAEFPFGTAFRAPDGHMMYLLGYTENDHLIVSPTNPFEDYEEAHAARVLVCVQHIRDLLVK